MPPIGPGETRVVDVPVVADDGGQARVSVCSTSRPLLECEGTVLAPTVIPVG